MLKVDKESLRELVLDLISETVLIWAMMLVGGVLTSFYLGHDESVLDSIHWAYFIYALWFAVLFKIGGEMMFKFRNWVEESRKVKSIQNG